MVSPALDYKDKLEVINTDVKGQEGAPPIDARVVTQPLNYNRKKDVC